MIKSLKDETDKVELANIYRLLRGCAALVNLGESNIAFRERFYILANN